MAQTEYQKQYNKEHPEKVAKWCKKYQETHKEEIRARRLAKYKAKQDVRLFDLLNDYNGGMAIEKLCDKYKVNYRS